jgi:competence protein ComEC
MAHILAISGFNVGVVAYVLMIFIKLIPFSRKAQLGIVIFLLITYAVITGASPSVVRATIMAVVFLVSFILERESQVLNSLFLAALGILIVNPLDLFDVGFQLSFVCVLAIILWHPVFYYSIFGENFLEKSMTVKRYLTNSLSVSVAVWIAVLGLIAYYFQIVTPITVLANLLITPLISAIVVLGLVFFAAHWIVPWMNMAFAGCIQVLLNIMLWIIYILDKIPGAHFYVQGMHVWMLGGYYLLLGAGVLFWWLLKKKSEARTM